MIRLVYIAGPFRAHTAWGIAENVRAAERVGLEVAHVGAMPVIPHSMTANFHGEGMGDAAWLAGTLELLRRCDAMVLIQGWERSEGSKAEQAEAERLGIPVWIWGNDTILHLSDWLSAWDGISAARDSEIAIVRREAACAVERTMTTAGLNHPVGSWRKDPEQATVSNHIGHAAQHCLAIVTADAISNYPSGIMDTRSREDAEHAVCRVVMGMLVGKSKGVVQPKGGSR